MSFYQKLIRPLLFNISPETAHEIGIESLKIGLSSGAAQDFVAKKLAVESFGKLERFGLKFKNPLGIAAGFDKNGIVVNQLAALGFGFVEVGTVTFKPQSGNEKPRLFRLPQDQALINRLGFNNQGTPKVVERLRKLNRKCVLGVNIGKNKDVPNEEAIENYLKSFDLAHEVADYIAVNVSSPNTPNLRELQKAENLEELLGELQKRNKVLSRALRQQNGAEKPPEGGTPNLKPLLVKIAPDLSEQEIEAIVDIVSRLDLSGIIATNTTISRENLKTNINETGGLSGKPVREKSTEVISKIYKYSNGKIPIIGVGGIFNAEDAFEKIAAGACLVQAYTGFVYQGISFAKEVNSGLNDIFKKRGFKDVDEAVGSDVKI
ncbi:MAG: quinone-dependent dihydroorotate dehydrogenase [Pyrinomonadaceae bacterium]|nr:quinone-dependent dihydroorotate dehydrogenase [Pyrinomonadaceae bacterium]